jgi:ankyrin repeat protein
MENQSEVQARALEPTLGSATSPASRRTVRSLAALQPASRDNRLMCYSQSDLGNLVRCTLASGAPANLRFDEDDTRVLCLAASHGAARSLKALLTGGADVRLVNKKGYTALHWAAQKGFMACIALLLDTGAPLEAQTRCAARQRPVTARCL